MTNINDLYTIDYNLEYGFVFMQNTDLDKTVFQACLIQREDGNGFKKAIDSSDCGYNDGICGDLNFRYAELETIEIVKEFFFTLARKAGIRII